MHLKDDYQKWEFLTHDADKQSEHERQFKFMITYVLRSLLQNDIYLLKASCIPVNFRADSVDPTLIFHERPSLDSPRFGGFGTAIFPL